MKSSDEPVIVEQTYATPITKVWAVITEVDQITMQMAPLSSDTYTIYFNDFIS